MQISSQLQSNAQRPVKQLAAVDHIYKFSEYAEDDGKSPYADENPSGFAGNARKERASRSVRKVKSKLDRFLSLKKKTRRMEEEVEHKKDVLRSMQEKVVRLRGYEEDKKLDSGWTVLPKKGKIKEPSPPSVDDCIIS